MPRCLPLLHLRPDPEASESGLYVTEEVVALCQASAKLGCQEALFTLGEKPELRYRAVGSPR